MFFNHTCELLLSVAITTCSRRHFVHNAMQESRKIRFLVSQILHFNVILFVKRVFSRGQCNKLNKSISANTKHNTRWLLIIVLSGLNQSDNLSIKWNKSHRNIKWIDFAGFSRILSLSPLLTMILYKVLATKNRNLQHFVHCHYLIKYPGNKSQSQRQ